MIAGLMREGKEFAGKGKRKSLKMKRGNELGVVEGTTRISADPALYVASFSNFILQIHLPSESEHIRS